jgi:hypothetical protein
MKKMLEGNNNGRSSSSSSIKEVDVYEPQEIELSNEEEDEGSCISVIHTKLTEKEQG